MPQQTTTLSSSGEMSEADERAHHLGKHMAKIRRRSTTNSIDLNSISMDHVRVSPAAGIASVQYKCKRAMHGKCVSNNTRNSITCVHISIAYMPRLPLTLPTWRVLLLPHSGLCGPMHIGCRLSNNTGIEAKYRRTGSFAIRTMDLFPSPGQMWQFVASYGVAL